MINDLPQGTVSGGLNINDSLDAGTPGSLSSDAALHGRALDFPRQSAPFEADLAVAGATKTLFITQALLVGQCS